MKRSQSRPRARIGILAAFAIVIGALTPLASEPTTAQAAYAAMIQPATGKVVSRVGDGCGSSRPGHQGIDISHNAGTPIVAAYGGTVSTRTYSSGYGNYVVIKHASGYTTLYAHMVSPGSVSVGQAVAQGQQIGVVGSTGNSTGPHLHFELRRNGVNIANQGYSCNSNVTRGNSIPMDFPGLGGSSLDYNSDGRADLLAISKTNALTVYMGNGNGGWSSETVGSGWGATRTIVHGDFNGDKKGDIIAVRNDGTLWFYRGNGANRFDATQVGHGWSAFSLITGGADFNGDGRADLVARDSSGNLKMYPGNGSGGFNTPTKIGNNWTSINMVVAGDFTGDGRGDIIGRNSSGDLFLYAGNGSTLSAGAKVGHGWAGMTAITGGGDYNSDGKSDLIARDAAGKLFLYPGRGANGFDSRVEVGHGWNTHRLIS